MHPRRLQRGYEDPYHALAFPILRGEALLQAPKRQLQLLDPLELL